MRFDYGGCIGSHAVAGESQRACTAIGRGSAVFSEIMAAPDKGIPQELLENAHCIVIVPDLKTAAFVFGGKYGKGYLSLPKQKRTGLVRARPRSASRVGALASRSAALRRT